MFKPRVDILMATYNGEKYLTTQLQSILQQDYHDWRLLIHDDGSVDDTLEIIRSFSRTDRRIVLLEDEVKSLGAAQNFLHLLTHTDADYIFFADQDDWWFPNKISKQLAAFPNTEEPIAQYCNAHYLIGQQVVKKKVNQLHPVKISQQLFLNGGIVGCTILINRALQQLLSPPPGVVAMHDYLMVTAALTFGKLVYLDMPLMHYRQHDHNVTGKQERGFYAKFTGKFLSKRTLVDDRHFQANKAFYSRYNVQLSTASRKVFEAYLAIIQEKNIFNKFVLLHRYRFQLAHKKYLLYLKTILRKTLND